MGIAQPADGEQSKLWNGASGQAWIDMQPVLDRMYEPFEALLVETCKDAASRSVLDVGCGPGGTTLAIARALGDSGVCTGVDISAPMIAMARARAAQAGCPAAFLCADAQTHAFGHAQFDRIVSRFGVMFFEDPVRAFANLRRAATRDAALRFIAWRSAEENPFMTLAERTAAPMLPNLPKRQPNMPGQFAFAEQQRMRALLDGGGWAHVAIGPIDVSCSMPETQLVSYLTRLGPVGRVLQDVDPRTRTDVIDAMRAAFEPFVYGDDVRFTAACWDVSARASAGSGQG